MTGQSQGSRQAPAAGTERFNVGNHTFQVAMLFTNYTLELQTF